jgi:hypothetical protein
MGLRRTLTWIAIAPLGLGLTTGLTITTTLLTQQPIGLSSEPLSAGDALAPRATTPAAERRAHAVRPASGAVSHGGRAVATGRADTQPVASASPPAVPPSPPAPPPAAATTPPPTPVKQPAHTPTRTPTPAQRDGGRDGRGSSDRGGSDRGGDENSGSGQRDD